MSFKVFLPQKQLRVNVPTKSTLLIEAMKTFKLQASANCYKQYQQQIVNKQLFTRS